jgi:hypothetical protein
MNLGSTAVVSDPNEKRNLSSEKLRHFYVEEMAKELLQVDEISLESRAYLVKTTLPNVVIALENLMKEMKSKNISLNATKQLAQQDKIQLDKPLQQFDSLNWIGLNDIK